MAKNYSGLDKTESFFAHYGRKGMKRGMNIFNPNYKPIGEKATETLKEKGFESYQKRAQNEQWRKQTAEANAKNAATSVGKTAADRQREAMAKATSAGGSSIRRENLVKAEQKRYSDMAKAKTEEAEKEGTAYKINSDLQQTERINDEIKDAKKFLNLLDEFEKNSTIGTLGTSTMREAAENFKLSAEHYKKQRQELSKLLAGNDSASYYKENRKAAEETGSSIVQDYESALFGYRSAYDKFAEASTKLRSLMKENDSRKASPSSEQEAMNRASSAATKSGAKSAREKLLEAERKRQAAIYRR